MISAKKLLPNGQEDPEAFFDSPQTVARNKARMASTPGESPSARRGGNAYHQQADEHEEYEDRLAGEDFGGGGYSDEEGEGDDMEVDDGESCSIVLYPVGHVLIQSFLGTSLTPSTYRRANKSGSSSSHRTSNGNNDSPTLASSHTGRNNGVKTPSRLKESYTNNSMDSDEESSADDGADEVRRVVTGGRGNNTSSGKVGSSNRRSSVQSRRQSMPNEGSESDDSEGGSASQSRPKASNSRLSSGNRRVSSGSSSPPKKGSQSKAEGKRRAREESIEPPADEFDWPEGANGDDDTGRFDHQEEQYDEEQEEEEDQAGRASGSKRKSPPKKSAKAKKDGQTGSKEVVTKIVSKQSKKRSYEGDDSGDSKFLTIPSAFCKSSLFRAMHRPSILAKQSRASCLLEE